MRDGKGRFLPGNPGRPIGSSRIALRAKVEDLLTDLYPDFIDKLKSLEGQQFVSEYLKLLPYALPKLKETEHDLHSLNEGDLLKIINHLKEIDHEKKID